MNHSIENRYVGELRTSSTHVKTGKNIITDAPIDNNGKGQAFAPTDLVSTALCSCITTVMGICAEKGKFEMPNSKAKITKLMSTNPRKISEIHLRIYFKINFPDREKKMLEKAAHSCPVHQSLHADIKKVITFNYPKV